MNLCLKLSLIPPAWCLSLINPIHKQGPKPKPENYSGISIMNALLKVLSIMLNCRLNDFCENNNVINRGQLGFRKNNGTIDQVTTLKTIINKYVYDNKKKLYTCFVDCKKAFDSIWHEGLFYKLSKNKINGNFLDLIKNIYKHTRCAVKVDNKLTNFFEYTLFNIFVNDLNDEIESVNTSPVNLNDEEKFSSLMYADDLVMISTTKEGLQNMLNKLDEYSQKWNIDVNYTKTKCVTFSKDNRKESHRFTINSPRL